MRGGKVRLIRSTKKPGRRREYQDGVNGNVVDFLANAQTPVRYPATCPGYAVGRRVGTFTKYGT